MVIDEAFSKLDDDNARFAMQLFDQFVTDVQQIRQRLPALEPLLSS